jgi:hypothetical protein
MTKKRQPIDDLIDAHVWLTRDKTATMSPTNTKAQKALHYIRKLNMGDKSILDRLELACFTVSASGLVFHNVMRGPPPRDDNSLAVVAVVDTATPQGKQRIRDFIGSTAEEVLAPYPQRFVIYSLQREGAWVRVCADEDLVINEVLKLVRKPPESPATVDVLLFLEPAFHLRLNKAVADEALKLSAAGGTA